MTTGKKSKKKVFADKKKGFGFFRILLLLIVGIPAFAVLGLYLFFDPNAYRGEIAAALSQQTGRKIALDGPLGWSVSLADGVGFKIADVAVGNPAWASRPLMAKIGSARLHLGLTGLASGKVEIVAFDLADADILLETGPAGKGNWDFAAEPKDATPPKEAAKDEPKAAAQASPVSIDVRAVRVTGSRFGLREAGGAVTLLEVPLLSLEGNSKKLQAHFEGKAAGKALEIDLTGGPLAALGKKNWPFDADVAFEKKLRLKTRGTLAEAFKRVDIDALSLTAGPSQIDGKMAVTLGGGRPSIKGSLDAKRLDAADFGGASEEAKTKGAIGQYLPDTVTGSKAPPKKDEAKTERLFSREPLPLEGLKAADADLQIKAEDIVSGAFAAQNLQTHLVLKDGRLTLSPFSVHLAGSKLEGQVMLDAGAPEARLALMLKGDGIDVSKLMDLSGAESFLAGKADLFVDVTSNGRSPYDLASHADGAFNMQMDAGQVSRSELKSIAAGLVDIFLPGAGSLASPGINCLAARSKIKNGLVSVTGLLLDTDATTVGGLGTVNLPEERLNLTLRTRPKNVGLGAVIPPMKVYGPLTSPAVTADAVGSIQKVVGVFMGDKAAPEAGVPEIAKVEGKNACAVTLDNPALAAQTATGQGSAAPSLPDLKGVKDTVKDVGGKLLDGLGQGLFGK